METAPVTVIAGRYEVGELLGRGGMAEVFAGIDRRLDRAVAIKLLRPEISARPDLRTRFEAEARAAASLSHPNAVAVFDTGEEDGVPYIVMERLPGRTLADLIAAGPLEPALVQRVAGEVLGALGAAHATGLAHRDVKPGNVLIAADGSAKVSDFGIAKSVEAEEESSDLTGTGQLLGTPAYVAPERLDGAPATAQSDIYALGVVLYEALAGVKPFDGATPLATARAISSGAHRPLSEIRPDLDSALVTAVEQAMATDPARRFSSAAAMASAVAGRAAAAGVAADTVDNVGHEAAGADTVGMSPDDTMVLDGAEGVAVAPGSQAVPGRRLPIAGVVVAGLAAVVAVILFAGIGSNGDTSGSPGTAAGPAPTTGAPTTAPASPSGRLALALRHAATGFSASDGSFAPQVAARLSQIADAVEAGNGAPGATALLTVLPAWNRAGLLSDSATTTAVALLEQVPGVDLTAYRAVATTAAPPATRGKHGKDKTENG